MSPVLQRLLLLLFSWFWNEIQTFLIDNIMCVCGTLGKARGEAGESVCENEKLHEERISPHTRISAVRGDRIFQYKRSVRRNMGEVADEDGKRYD